MRGIGITTKSSNYSRNYSRNYSSSGISSSNSDTLDVLSSSYSSADESSRRHSFSSQEEAEEGDIVFVVKNRRWNGTPSAAAVVEEKSNTKEEDNDDEDPYADVREELEGLSERDKYEFRSGKFEKKCEKGRRVFWMKWSCYWELGILMLVGHVRDFFGWLFHCGRYFSQTSSKHKRRLLRDRKKGEEESRYYAPLAPKSVAFYLRRVYHRVHDSFNRPVASNPGAFISVLERISYDGFKILSLLSSQTKANSQIIQGEYQNGPYYTSTHGRASRRCLNLSSYNYLGFADNWSSSSCGIAVTNALSSSSSLPISTSSSRSDFGTTYLHKQLEQTVSQFLHKDDAICFNMGFNTNATTIPALLSKGDLILSDELNHTSIVFGAKASGATISVFRHNDANHLEMLLRQAIVQGQTTIHKTSSSSNNNNNINNSNNDSNNKNCHQRKPWRKILVLVEGLYSMDGEYCDLPNILRVSRQYGAYLYLDEAHSIGALGQSGRGCCEYTGVDPRQVDILMGTFTKSFGGMGGYIAADATLIRHLRTHCAATLYQTSMSPIVCQQILSSFHVLMGKDGTNIGKHKLNSLRDNANYVRMRLRQMNLKVLGNYDSPIIPILLYKYSNISAFSRECYKRGLAVVIVGAPAVPFFTCRVRLCLSASHKRSDLDRALRDLEDIVELFQIRYG